MKKLILLLTMAFSLNVHAGAQSDIPVELMDLDNQGRLTFIKNALANIGVVTGSYKHLVSIIIGGENTIHDEEKGAYIGYFAELQTSAGKYSCEERIVLGVFVQTRPDLVGKHPVECRLIP
jgi:hypothetical protein